MRSKLVLAALAILSTIPAFAQVAPAARIHGLPLGVGVGVSDFNTDYYRPFIPYWSGRMIGVSAWADYNVYHGLGVEIEGASIFSGAPKARSPFPNAKLFGNLKEQTVQAGIIYRARPFFKVRPFVKGLGGIGKIDFPSTNPFYVSETSALYSAGGGLEYRVWNNFYARGQYEYQWWKGFRSDSQSLNPAGFTIGATYYLRGIHRHY